MKSEPVTILHIEDNDDHAELVSRELKELGIGNRIERAADGEEALDYLFGKGKYADRNAYPLPGLILLDLRLPKIDGLDVLKQIKHDDKLKIIPVVMLTSSDAEHDKLEAYGNYVNSFITKPIDFQKFTKIMHELGYYWLFCNNRPI